MVTKAEFNAANRRASRNRGSSPRILSARYDRRAHRILLDLNTRVHLAFSPDDVEGMQDATASQLSTIEISPSGHGIHIPALDADLLLPALLEGFLGSRKWMAARLGAAGGSTTSEVKAAASRQNGKLGGRPRRVAS